MKIPRSARRFLNSRRIRRMRGHFAEAYDSWKRSGNPADLAMAEQWHEKLSALGV